MQLVDHMVSLVRITKVAVPVLYFWASLLATVLLAWTRSLGWQGWGGQAYVSSLPVCIWLPCWAKPSSPAERVKTEDLFFTHKEGPIFDKVWCWSNSGHLKSPSPCLGQVGRAHCPGRSTCALRFRILDLGVGTWTGENISYFDMWSCWVLSPQSPRQTDAPRSEPPAPVHILLFQNVDKLPSTLICIIPKLRVIPVFWK